jgi:hypothetical protein
MQHLCDMAAATGCTLAGYARFRLFANAALDEDHHEGAGATDAAARMRARLAAGLAAALHRRQPAWLDPEAHDAP